MELKHSQSTIRTSWIIAEATLISLILVLRFGRAAENETTSGETLSKQWANLVDISTILLVIGGDIVQTSLAQGTGKWFTPVCFSFGWVAYAFIALIGIIGEGRLLPPPDYPVKVFNLTSGYVRENKNWVVGRILRDIEADLAKEEPLNEYAIRISFYKAAENNNAPTQFSYSWMHLFGFICILVQLALATLPIVLDEEWDVMLITGVGTILAQIAGSLPQWRAEKLPNRQGKQDIFALTQGNGSRDIVVIEGCGNCLDLEEMSASQSPRLGKPWEKFDINGFFPLAQMYSSDQPENKENMLRRSRHIGSCPLGFWVTRIVCVTQSVLWLLLLNVVATLRNYNSVLLAIGCLGMFQNGFLAAMSRSNETRNLPLMRGNTIYAQKVMDGIMDLHISHGGAEPLLHEFFPGKLRPDEKDWWNGKKDAYDKPAYLKEKKPIELPVRGPNTATKLKLYGVPVTTEKAILEQPQRQADESCLAAFGYLRRGKFRDAEILFGRTQYIYRSLIPLGPGVQERVQGLQICRARAMVCMARYDMALELLGTIHPLTKHIDKERLVVLAMTYEHKGDYGAALHILNKLEAGTNTDHIQDINDAQIHFTIYRLLALCYARLGKHMEALEAHAQASKVIMEVERGDIQRRDQFQEPSIMTEISNDVFTWKGILRLATAVIYMLFGDIRKASEEAKCAYNDLTCILGTSNIQTLEALSIYCRLRAYNSPMDAERFCMDSMHEAVRILGNGHPLATEIIHAIVHILLHETKFSAAIATVQDLCNDVHKIVGEDHPQTFQSYSQLAEVYRLAGKYWDAERVAIEVVQFSQGKWSHDHPLTLRCTTELAYIHYHIGKFSTARNEVMGVINIQRLFFSKEIDKCKPDKSKRPETPRIEQNKEDNAQIIRSILSKIVDGTEYLRSNEDLLFSLEVFAKLEDKTADPDIGLIFEILKAIHRRREQDLGGRHPLTLTAEFGLATVYRKYGQLDTAEAHFASIYKTRLEVLGDRHTKTLEVNQELLLTLAAQGKYGLDVTRRNVAKTC